MPYSRVGFLPYISGSVFQQIDNEKCRIKENLEISDQEFRKTNSLVVGYKEN